MTDHLASDVALLLSAGMGKRMRPLTATRPKPLVRVAGKALIDYSLDKLDEAGVARAVVNVHFMADQLMAHLGCTQLRGCLFGRPVSADAVRMTPRQQNERGCPPRRRA